VLLEHDGVPVAYALYRMNQSFVDGSTTGKVIVREAVGATDAATREIWRFLLDIDWVAHIEASLLPVDHPLLLLLAEPRRARFRLGDGLWMRLVDVGASLSARTYSGDGGVTLEIEDALIPENSGRWHVEGGTAKRTDGDPDLRLDVAALGSAYLGGITFGQLARAGRVEELAAGALGRADALFRAERAPWCPEIF
jgi:predicted acetyltransferase